MKKLISLFLSFVCVVFLAYNANAQVATNYTWSQASSTYTPITGGTVLATATGNTTATSIDDVIFNLPSGTIPFTFTYDGTGYTGCNVSSNGFITFGATAPAANNYTPLSNTAAYTGAIAAVGGDNNGLFIGANIGEIRYETVGSEFIIQYSNFRPFSTSAVSPYWIWNFQIRLHSNGSIRIVYNNSFVGAPTASTRQVGLRGPSNAFATNVNNRLVTNGTHTWTTSLAGTTNASSCGQSSTIPNVPPSGHTYIWSPPIPDSIDVRVSSVVIGAVGKIYSVGKGYDLTSTVSNLGTISQSNIPVYYNVNNGPAIGPVNAAGPIPFNGTENVVFSGGNAFVPASAGAYTIKSWTVQPGDQKPGNDTTTLVITVSDKVNTFPYVQNFTSPIGWTFLTTVPGGSVTPWVLVAAVNPDGVAADAVIRSDFFSGSNSTGRVSILRTPEMDFTGMANPVLNFYVAYRTFTGLEPDRIQVLVSTDGGVTFNPASTPYNKTHLTDPSLATLPPSGSAYTPANQSEWRHETVDLSNVGNNSNVVVGFVATSAWGNNGYIDNVIISEPNSLCTDDVTGPGSYNCNALVTLDFTATPVPPSNNGIEKSSVIKNEVNQESNVIPITGTTGNAVVNSSSQFDNPNGGTAFVSEYTNNDPGQIIAPNVGVTDATPPVGPAYDPTFVYHDYWFTVTYDGNDQTGYATYDIKIDLDGLVFTDPTTLYVVKRSDRTGAWVCQNTTISGNTLIVTGLTDFSDFALAGSEALPVELSSFVSTISGNSVTLNWTTASEINNSGFDIERSSVSGTWSKVGSVSGNGTSATPHSYTFTERNVASGSHNYRLKQIDFNGNFEYFNLSNEVVIGIPAEFKLSQNYPNPFNPSTTISYEIPVDGAVSLKIFDMSGKEVMTLVDGVKNAGYYSINFNASNLSSGIYFYKLSANDFTSVKKMMLVK